VTAVEEHRSLWATALASLLLCACALGLLSRTSVAGLEGQTATQSDAAEAYGKLPLSFVQNAGQVDRAVRYYAQGAGYSFYFARHKAVLALEKGKHGQALDLRFLGANPNARLTASDRASGTVNYFQGVQRHTDLATYKRLIYRNLWPGIDMVFRGGSGRLEYAFRVRPGADPADIRLAYAGDQGVSVGREGALRIKTSLGTLKDARPRSFQSIDGHRVAVGSRYALGGGSYGIAVGRYDRDQRLVIDPSLAYSTFLGGASDDAGRGIAVDSSGAAFVTGETASADFPTTAGAFDTSHDDPSPYSDVFVTKLDPAGTGTDYSTYLGGVTGGSFGPDDLGRGIAVDASGAAYVTGYTSSSDFPTTPGAFDTTYNGGYDAFITKLNPSGSNLDYSTYLGGTDNEIGSGIALDSAGAAYITGRTLSTDLPTSPGAFDSSYDGGPGEFDSFVTKLDPIGSSLSYSTYLGGTLSDVGNGIAVDSSGRAHVVGNTRSADFPITPGALDTSQNGGPEDAFVTTVAPSGSTLFGSTYLGSSDQDIGQGITTDAAGITYVTGETDTGPGATDFPTTGGAFDTSANGNLDVFLSKLSADDSSLVYSTLVGGGGNDLGQSVAIDSSGAAYVDGNTSSTDFPMVNAVIATAPGSDDAIALKVDPTGAALGYSTYLGGTDSDLGTGIAVDASGAAYLAGFTNSADFQTTPGAVDGSPGGGFDAFVSKLAPGSNADNSASEQAPPGGTVSTNTTATPGDPVGTSVTTPNAGQVTINEGPTTTPDPNNYSLLDQQVQISAPVATAASPLVIRFYLDASALPDGTDPSSVQVFRNGTVLATCNGGTAANPDPCLASRSVNAGGDLTLTVRTSHASTWNFGIRTGYTFQGYYPPISSPPAFNAVDSGSVVALRFSLGGFQGRRILAAGYPRSHRITCTSSATNLGDDAPTSGFLSYNSRSRRYTYFWRTRRMWVGTCRQFVLRLKDGTSHPANFRFTR
jgi:beta-propeller repeat-containing protein